MLIALAGFVVVSLIVGLITYSQLLQAAREKGKLENDLIEAMSQLQRIEQVLADVDTVQRYREKVTKSFQGYVDFAEVPDKKVISAKNLMENNPTKTSIFTSVPLTTPVIGFVSQSFKHPGHTGIDIVAPIGTPIKAAADGRVLFSGWTPKDGNMVILYHRGGYFTYYWHNSRNLVSVNQDVRQGEIIAFTGNSGESSSGPHLHFEIWKDALPVNPEHYLSELNVGE